MAHFVWVRLSEYPNLNMWMLSNNNLSPPKHVQQQLINTRSLEGHHFQREDEHDTRFSESNHLVEQGYNEPETTELLDQTHRARANSQEFLRLFQSGSEIQEEGLGMQRNISARASTRSMPGIILRRTTMDMGNVRKIKDLRSQVIQNCEVESRVPYRKRARSMFDPLPDVPVSSSEQKQTNVPLIEEEQDLLNITPVTVVVCPSSAEDRVPTEPSESLDPITPNIRSTSPKQFEFEDGTFLGVDVPSFQDPEISGELENDVEKSFVSIYSSQILSKFTEGSSKDDEEGEEAGESNQ